MERAIKSIFVWKNKKYQVVEANNEQCDGCAFETFSCNYCSILLKEAGFCSFLDRKDRRSVIFKRVKDE